MIRRTIREWERIGYGGDETTIPTAQADSIAAVARASIFSGKHGNGVLEHGRKGLRAQGVVGVIATPECQLEILPKIEGNGTDEIPNSSLRNRLIHMISAVYDLPIEVSAITQLGSQQDTVLEILIRLFCDKLINSIRRGMPRKYLGHHDDLASLRGTIDVARQFSVLAFSPQKLACRFDELSSDILLNQVMRAAVTKLSRLAKSAKVQRILRELQFAYADIADIPAKSIRWNQIMFDRTNQRWSELVSLARLFLTDNHHQTSAGNIHGHALLFEMNILFERYIARILTSALVATNLDVSSQGGHRDCLYEGTVGRFRTRPDLIIRQSGKIVLIIDTKWKRLTPQFDDPKHGVSQTDVYQLMAYSQLYDCQNVMLLYPHHGGLQPERIRRRHSIAFPNSVRTLTFATIDVGGPLGSHKTALRQLIRDVLPRDLGCSQFPERGIAVGGAT